MPENSSNPCSSTTTNFAIYRWNADINAWDAIPGGNCCSPSFAPPDPNTLPPGTFNGQEEPFPCVPAAGTTDPQTGKPCS